MASLLQPSALSLEPSAFSRSAVSRSALQPSAFSPPVQPSALSLQAQRQRSASAFRPRPSAFSHHPSAIGPPQSSRSGALNLRIRRLTTSPSHLPTFTLPSSLPPCPPAHISVPTTNTRRGADRANAPIFHPISARCGGTRVADSERPISRRGMDVSDASPVRRPPLRLPQLA